MSTILLQPVPTVATRSTSSIQGTSRLYDILQTVVLLTLKVKMLSSHANCKVIGSNGKVDKIRWVIEKANVNALINYKTTDNLTGELGKLASVNIDVYFDNVGGDYLEAAIGHMNDFGCIG